MTDAVAHRKHIIVSNYRVVRKLGNWPINQKVASALFPVTSPNADQF